MAGLILGMPFAHAGTTYLDTAKTLLKDSIAMRTVAGNGKVPELANYLMDTFRKAGFAEQDIHYLPYGETAALVIRYRGDGSSGKKPVMLSAHMDVVDAIPSDWERDPFTMVEENGYLFGRGVADDKYGIAMLSTTLLRLKAENFTPSRDILLVLSGDEETEMATADMLATKYRDLIDAEFALIADGGGGLLDEQGNPVSFSVDSAEKTYASYTVTARNPGGHSSLPRSDNAIYDLARALTNISGYAFPVQHNDLTRAYFAKSAPLFDGQIAKAMADFAVDPADKKAIAELRKHPEFGGATGTTCVATMLSGGHADNALPQSATATVNCRIFPGISVEETMAELKKVADNPALEWAVLNSEKESPASPVSNELFGVIEQAVHASYPGVPVIPHMALGASDALHYRAAGIPSYTLMGLFMKASDEYAHGLNERVPVDSLPFGLDMWYRIVKSLCE